MLSDWTDDYFENFNIYQLISYYTGNIIGICLDNSGSHIVNTICQWQIKEWNTLICPENLESTKFVSLMINFFD